MSAQPPCPAPAVQAGLLVRLLRDRAGNTLAMAAAALFPLLGLIGGGVDIGRAYLSQSRLQQACDSGVLAARKRLGTEVAVTGDIPEEAAASGERFFNLNFRNGAYGTEERTFQMTLEEDFSIAGQATVEVPTTLMAIFGYDMMPVEVECVAQLNMTDSDIMLVLDVTGSMAQTNPGDPVPKIVAMKAVVRSFHQQVLAAAPPSSQIRFGFVPYSANVNVGGLLKDDWVNTEWEYQSRAFHVTTGLGIPQWRYDAIEKDVSNWRTESNGCIEERATYEIDDYDHVDLTRALDLDIDLVPTDDEDTKWSPAYPHLIYARSLTYFGGGSFTTAQMVTTADYVSPMLIGSASCPAAARKLATMSEAQLNAYLATLVPTGNTYHDIGMIWGGRLLSPTGLFAAENANSARSTTTARHLVFMTDGETAPRDIVYSSYGLEPLDRRRWSPSSPLTLTQTVENRFAFACEEVKKRNITVWVVSFGIAPNPVLQACAGADKYFAADDAAELQQAFSSIAERMGELRVTR